MFFVAKSPFKRSVLRGTHVLLAFAALADHDMLSHLHDVMFVFVGAGVDVWWGGEACLALFSSSTNLSFSPTKGDRKGTEKN